MICSFSNKECLCRCRWCSTKICLPGWEEVELSRKGL